MQQGTTFSNAKSPTPLLYLSTENAEGWCAFLLGENEDYAEPEISFKTLWDGGGQFQTFDYGGDFLFSRKQPKDLGSNYLSKLRQAIKTIAVGHYNKSLVWLLDPDSPPSKNNLLVVPLFKESAGNFRVTQEAEITWGGAGQLNFVKDVFAKKEINGEYSAICFHIPATTPGLRPIGFGLAFGGSNFDLHRHSKQIPIGSTVSIPLSGDGRGCVRFEMDLLEDEDLMSFDLGQKFFFQKNGIATLSHFDFPLLREVRPNRYVRMQVSIDPANLQNFGQPGSLDTARTYLAFSGKTRMKNFPHTEEDTVFETWFRTHNGYRIKLRPNTAGAASDAQANTLFAGRQTARLVWCEKKKGSNDWYLAPAGEFFMVLEEEDVDKAVVNGQAHLLAGLSGTETIGFQPTTKNREGDRLRFQPYRPAFAPAFPLSGNGNGSDATAPLLTDQAQTSWANVVASNGQKISFASEPEGASLYSKEHGIQAISANGDGLLGFFELAVEMPQAEDFSVPLVPCEGAIVPTGERLDVFESQIISTERKTLISAKKPAPIIESKKSKGARGGRQAANFIHSTTPQGALANIQPDGAWNEVVLAQNSLDHDSLLPSTSQGLTEASPHYLNFTGSGEGTTGPEFKFGFLNLTEALKDAFQTNQQFLVASQSENLGIRFTDLTSKPANGETNEPLFNNKMYIREWPFFIKTGKNRPDDYRNVLIFKFCKGTLKERLTDPATWTKPGHFNQPDELPELASWMADFIEKAEAQTTKYFTHFNKIIADPQWNGILALNVDLAAANFPDGLKGLLGGLDLEQLTIHHFGIEINSVNAAGDLKIEENSSLFGLISYLDPAYSGGDMPVEPDTGTFDFKVLSLQVLFENTDIKDFASKVQVKLGKLLQDDVSNVAIQNEQGTFDNTGTQSLILNGTYEEHEGKMTYIFKQTKSNKFYLDSNILHFMEIGEAFFDTISVEDEQIRSRFRFGGSINFQILEGTDGPLDLLSFGSEEGQEGFDTGRGLKFANLCLDMDFRLVKLGEDKFEVQDRTFNQNVKDFSLNAGDSYRRVDSFYAKFPLTFQNFIFGTGAKLPAGYGFEPIQTTLPLEPITGEWLGLKFKSNLGTPGLLASKGPFDAEILLAWSPQGVEADKKYRLYFGILLPGAAGNSKLLSIQSVLKLLVGGVELKYVKRKPESPGAYLFHLNNLNVRFFNKNLLSEKLDNTLFLFANNRVVERKNVGWLFSYQVNAAEDLLKNYKGVWIPFVALGQHVSFKNPGNIQGIDDAMAEMQAAFFPDNDELLFEFVAGDTPEDEEGLELVFRDDSNWLIAFLFGLLKPEEVKRKKKKKKDDKKSDPKKKADDEDDYEIVKKDGFAIEAAVIFNDPEIYGLRLSLNGGQMKVFDGLEFEILYKKVTDSVGVFKILFTLPDAFREFEVGAASLTMPVLGVDIYTNGDFKIDIGFPYELDFSRSFNFEVQAGPLPLTGSAGIYFGKLSGETALMLPVVNAIDGKPVGRWGNVIVFGLGFEIGFGKGIDKGLLKALFKITFVTVLEGVVAPFIPDESVQPYGTGRNLDKTNYYWIQGTIGLVGILEGEVDFKIISAGVYLKVYALIQATFEAYKPVPLIVKAGVVATASIKILFVRIRFSFSTSVTVKVTIGSDRTLQAPWNYGLSRGSTRSAILMRSISDAIPVIGFGDFDYEVEKTGLSLLFSLQPALDDSQKPSYVALLMMNAGEFNTLSDHVFRWLARDFKGEKNPVLTMEDLEAMRDSLNESGPSREQIEAFLQKYFNLSIVGLEVEKDIETTVFPMLPGLKMTRNGETVNFSEFNEVGADYMNLVKNFLRELSLDVREAEISAAPASLATHIFEDYFLMIAKHLVDEAMESLENFSFELTDGHTLAGIANTTGVAAEVIAEQNKFHPLRAGSNFHELSENTGKPVAELAQEHLNEPNLFKFDGDKFLAIRGLESLSLEELLEDFERNHVAENLAGMVARYQLGGLRLPGIGSNDTSHFPLFQLTGQQFPMPEEPADDFKVELTPLQDEFNWILGGAGSLTLTYKAEAVKAMETGLKNAVADIALNFPANPAYLLEAVPQRFNLTNFSAWENSEEPHQSYLWYFPDPLMHHLFKNQNAGKNLSVKYGVFNEAKQRLEFFGKAAEWATLVNVTIKRKPGQDENNLRYELIGTDETGITLLERLLLSGEEILGENIQILYRQRENEGTEPATAGGDKRSLQSLDITALNTFITQANLSTETNPVTKGIRARMARGAAVPHGILNEPEDFVRLLWECSIVRSGGYYLFYQNLGTNKGLPDFIADKAGNPVPFFDETGTAELHFLIKTSEPGRFTNCAITDTTIAVAKAMVFAEDSQLKHNVALTPQSVVGYTVEREAPAEPDATKPEYYRALLENLYQLLAFRIQESDGFNSSRMGMPLAPANEVDDIDRFDRKSLAGPDDTWRYKMLFPMARFAASKSLRTLAGVPDPYAGIGQAPSFAMHWRDVFGNQPWAEQGISGAPLGYTDPLLGIGRWPNVAANYEFDPGVDDGFKLTIHLRYQKPDLTIKDEMTEEEKDNVRNRIVEARQTFAKIFYQLNQPKVKHELVSTFFKNGGKTLDASDLQVLSDFIEDIYTQLDTAATDPVTATLEVEFVSEDINPAGIFELEAGLKFERDANLVHADFKDSPEVVSAISYVQPIFGTAEDQLGRFAVDFEETFAGEKLKIATGINKDDLNTTQRRQDVWVVRMEQLKARIAAEPLYFALQPLSRKLENGEVNVFTYDLAKGLDMSQANLQSFTEIDLDTWARQFLEAVDDFLSPELSTSAYLVDKILKNNYLEQIVESKRTLAGRIVTGLTPIWVESGYPGEVAMEAAREKLKQQLLIKLRQAYLVNTVVQFGVGTNGGFTLDGLPVRLYGKPFVVNGNGTAQNGELEKNYSFTNAKIQLDATDSFLTFLFDTHYDETQAAVKFDLNYKITHIEHHIENNPDMDGYEMSSWLMFVNPADATGDSSLLVKSLGHLEIPVVLRNYPATPALERQFGVQSKPEIDKSPLANATQWDYGFTYTQRAAAQDTLKAKVTLNLVPEIRGRSRSASERTFFDQLATFIWHYPAIQRDLAEYLPKIHANTPANDGSLKNAGIALDAFRRLVQAVTEKWPEFGAFGKGARSARAFDTMKTNVEFDFEIQENGENGTFNMELRKLGISHPDAKLNLPGLQIEGYPAQLNVEPDGQHHYIFGSLDWPAAKGIPERTAVLEDLNILEWQNAIAEVYLTRNEDLSDKFTTRNEFIYTTPAVKFPNKIVPLLDNDSEVNIAKTGAGERVIRPLREHLRIFFKELMDRGLADDFQLIKLECQYAWQLRSGNSLPYVKLPVLLVPPYEFRVPAGWDLTNENSFVNQLARGIETWFSEYLPSDDNVNERFLFDLSIFSKMEASKLPVLRLRNVFLEVDDVSDLKA